MKLLCLYAMLVAGMLFAGCSSTVDDSDETSQGWGENDVQVDIATYQEALVEGYTQPVMPSPVGYGNVSANHGDRCDHGFPYTECTVPHQKKVVFHNKTANCTGPYAAMLQTQAASAISFWSNVLNNQGWTVTSDTANATPSTTSGRVDATLECFNNSSTTLIGGTTLNSIGSGIDHPGQPSEIYGGNSHIDTADLVTWAAFSTATTAQRSAQLYNIWAHEAGHQLGLGHTPCSSQVAGTRIMGLGACQDLDNASTWSAQSVSPTPETKWMHDFIP